jgi:hypothetical protein
MKRGPAILLIVFSLSVNAQSKQEIKALANAKLLELTVFGTKDSATLEKLFAKNATYIHSSGKVEKRDEAIRNIVHNKSVYVIADTLLSYDLKTYKDSSVVNHLFIAKEKKADGTESILRLNLKLVWVKEKGDWKLFRRQATKVQ